MVQIKSLHINHLRNDEDFGFQKRVLNLAQSTLTQEVDQPVVAQYKAAVDAFDAALKQSQKNSKTAAVLECDAQVDHLYVGFTYNIRSLTYHPTEEIREAAEPVLAIIDKYGALVDLPYNQQYGALHNSLQELTAVDVETQTLLGMQPWMSALSSAMSRFQIARDAQTFEQSEYQIGLVKDTRTAADAAYKKLVDSVNAFAIAFGEENYATFIAQVNVMVADAQATLKARATRAANAKAKEEAAAEGTTTEGTTTEGDTTEA